MNKKYYIYFIAFLLIFSSDLLKVKCYNEDLNVQRDTEIDEVYEEQVEKVPEIVENSLESSVTLFIFLKSVILVRFPSW